jgi:hypothetical protein
MDIAHRKSMCLLRGRDSSSLFNTSFVIYIECNIRVHMERRKVFEFVNEIDILTYGTSHIRRINFHSWLRVR